MAYMKKTARFLAAGLVVFAISLTSFSHVFAATAPPNIIGYQGRLLNANGVPITASTASMKFFLYSASSGGTCLWSNSSSSCDSNVPASTTARSVTLTNGLFSENLGDTGASLAYAAIPDSVFANNAAVYLEVNVQGETLTPRKLLTAAPYAINAQTLDGYDLIGSGSIYFPGTTGTTPTSGVGTRFMWIPSKAALRAGIITASGTTWDDANIGAQSIAFGTNTKANGGQSTAFGTLTIASGSMSTAFGFGSSASGEASTSFGTSTSAMGINSVAAGNTTTAFGDYTLAFGRNFSVNGTGSVGFNLGSTTTTMTAANAFAIIGGNVGIGTVAPTNILSLGNDAAQKFWIENSAGGTVGRALTIAAGGTVAGTANITGGNLILQSGLGTGTGASTISFQTGTTLGSGTTLQTMSTKMTILGNGSVGIGTTAPTNILSLGNDVAQKFWIENSATDIVGRALTVAAGGTIAGTSVSNITGGNLILQSGLGTGTGASTISFQTGTTLGSGTTLQTMSTKMTILGNGSVGIGTTAPASTSLAEFALGATSQVLIDASTTAHTSATAPLLVRAAVGPANVSLAATSISITSTGLDTAFDAAIGQSVNLATSASDAASTFYIGSNVTTTGSGAGGLGGVTGYRMALDDTAGGIDPTFTGNSVGFQVFSDHSPSSASTATDYGFYAQMQNRATTAISSLTGAYLELNGSFNASTNVIGVDIFNASSTVDRADTAVRINGNTAWTTGISIGKATTDIVAGTNEDLTIASNGSGKVLINLPTPTNGQTFAVQTGGTSFMTFADTGIITEDLLSTTSTAHTINTNSLTSGVGLSILSTAAALTSGSLLNISSATTGTVVTNGIVSIKATQDYGSTSNVGLLNVVADATTAGTVARISGAAVNTGTGLIISTGAVTTGTSLLVSGSTVLTSGNTISMVNGRASFTPTNTIASSVSATWNGFTIPATTATLTGGADVTTATGFNLFNISQPTITDSSVATVTNAASLYIANAPAAAGSIKITNAYALWLDNGMARLDGGLTFSSASGTRTERLCQSGGGTGDGVALTNAVIGDCSAAGQADYAEMYPVAADITYGDVVAIGTQDVITKQGSHITQLVKSHASYQGNIVGIVSNNYEDPTSVGYNIQSADNPFPVALNGRVPVHVTSENGPILPGDFLTTSATMPGYAMKATGPGMVIGISLGYWNGVGNGTVMVFVQLGWHAGGAITTSGTLPTFASDFAFASLGDALPELPGKGSRFLRFNGSGWNGVSAEAVAMSVSVKTTDAGHYRLSFSNKTDTEVAYVNQSGDLILSGKLYPSDRGTAQTSKYIYYDGSAGPGGDMMRSNAAGWSTGSLDFAEMFPSPEQLVAGEVVIFSKLSGTVERSKVKASSHLAGIVSTKPGFLAGENLSDHYPIALKGRVPVLVNDENGAIEVGDPLTSSSTPGYAMKATKPGMIVGYALDPMMEKAGSIIAFVNLTYWQPENSTIAQTSVPGTANTASNFGAQASGASFTSLSMNGALYLNGSDIISVRRLSGIADHWSIEEDGTFKTEGSYKTYITSLQNEKVETVAMLSREQKISLSGASQLVNGHATVQFEAVDPKFNDIISTTAPVRVLVTLRGPANGVYVSFADHNGFDVQEFSGGSSTVQFDWFVEAYRLGFEPASATIAAPIPATASQPAPSTNATISPAAEIPPATILAPVPETTTPTMSPPSETGKAPVSPPTVTPPVETAAATVTAPIPATTSQPPGSVTGETLPAAAAPSPAPASEPPSAAPPVIEAPVSAPAAPTVQP